MLALKSKPKRKAPSSARIARAKPCNKSATGAIQPAFGSVSLQAKLKIGEPNDKYEQEADRVADEVMRMPDPMVTDVAAVNPGAKNSGNFPGSGPASIQRTCTECAMEEENKLQRKSISNRSVPPRISALNGSVAARFPLPRQEVVIQRQEGLKEEEENEGLIQAKTTGGVTPEVTPVISSGIQSLQGCGRPLSGSERSFFEPRFGVDFSSVRVHNDTRAASVARSVNAHAFTLGHNVVFGAGQYTPGTATGKVLLAHELTHVVQQQAADPETATVQRYRRPGSVNFGAKDTAALKEKQFDSKAPDPYVKHIQVNFTSTKAVDGETVPKGALSANYANNGASSIPANISGIGILGGFPSSGLTDKTTNNKVDRVEGWGYHHKAVPRESRVGSKWPQYKYFKPAEGGQASMSYALFFKGKIALHFGGLDTGSLGCVHIEDDSVMKRLNYHTRAGVTKVTVTYNEAALKIPCCERHETVGRMVSNPCGGRDPDDCS